VVGRTTPLTVLSEQGHAGEGLPTARAPVLLHVRVGLEVGAQVGPVGERAATVAAPERLLPGVCPHVPLEQPGPGESLAACGTLARQSVRADVHLEGAKGGVGLVTHLAGELLLDVQGTVELSVFAQPAARGVALAAGRALVARGW
ncbi:hypothetical protein EGW08_003952, partial [Elysia chlorotica]